MELDRRVLTCHSVALTLCTLCIGRNVVRDGYIGITRTLQCLTAIFSKFFANAV